MTVLLLLVWGAGPGLVHAHNHEPFYRDLSGHWARSWIEVLWEEGVTDGYQVLTYSPHLGWHRESRFRPDTNMRLDSWTTLAAKVFDLTPIPAERNHWLEGGQEVSGWLEAARQAGWLQSPVYWTDNVTRQVAIRFLVTALDLEPYSLGLSASQVSQALDRYRDRHKIDSSARRYVAAATILGIVEGYPDGTFRPQDYMTRAEAATMLARSALARVSAHPNPFSPDGDGIEDYTDFQLASLRNRNISRWELVVEDGGRRQVWATGTRYGRAPQHPDSVRWDGVDGGGSTLNPGDYFYHFSVWDRNGQQFSSVRKPISLVWRRLQGGLEPADLYPSDTLSVWASTWGDASRVTASVPGLNLTTTLQRERRGSATTPDRWVGSIVIPHDAPPGPQSLTLKAQFGGAERTVNLTFHVRDRVWLQARLEPSITPAGGLVTVYAESSTNVTAVHAAFPDGSQLPLLSPLPGQWHRTWIVPVELDQGTYPVVVTAESPYGPRQVELWLTVAGDVREEVQTVLTH